MAEQDGMYPTAAAPVPVPVAVSVRVQALLMRGLARLPHRIRRALAGPPVVVDGVELAVDAQLLIRLLAASGSTLVVEGSATASRAALERGAPVLAGRPVAGLDAREVTVAGGGGRLGATLYTPAAAPAVSPLLVFFHGGGWVIGSRRGYDHVARFVADRARIRVLSVDYRLAPEDPFPAAVDDAVAAFDDAVVRAGEFGTGPDRIAIGGDSAGANVAAAAARLVAARLHGPVPARQWLLYPATDLARAHPSRRRFGEGFLLTDGDIGWFQDQYAPAGVDRTDPRLSPLLGTVHPRTPPAHVVTAGFDPLRDEGEAYAEKLRRAGVVVTAVREPDLIHGFLPFVHAGPRFHRAVADATDALRSSPAPQYPC